MKIETLVSDIYDLFRTSHIWSEDRIVEFGNKLGRMISDRMSEVRETPRLRLSNLGTPCSRKLWYSINAPKLGEPLEPQARIKFLMGDIWELLLLFLAKEAGHEVTDEQKEVSLFGVKGHIDAVIDRAVVDAKSASSYGFRKFEDHLKPETDDFGYLTQLAAYDSAGNPDAVGGEGNEPAFLAVDKQLGKITLDIQPRRVVDWKQVVEDKTSMLEHPLPPERHYKDEAMGSSGNRKIPMPCGYCQFKKPCWGNLRMFAYSNGPVWLTRVVRTPDVPEI